MPTSKNEPSSLLVDLSVNHDECRMCKILEELPASERDALLLVLKKIIEKNTTQLGRSQHFYSYRWLAEVLTKHGFKIDKKDVRKYAIGKCSC